MKFSKQNFFLSTILTLVCCPIIMFAQNPLIGKWADNSHKEKQVEMFLSNDKIQGKDISGKIIFKDLVYDNNTKTYNGILINPEDSGEAFKIAISLSTKTTFTFKVTKFIFSKSFKFIKIN